MGRDAIRDTTQTTRSVAADSATPKATAGVHPGTEDALAGLQLRSDKGGIVFIGPTAEPLRALDSLLASPEVEPVEVTGELLTSWVTSPDEVVVLARNVSAAIRAGNTAVVYLDSHREGAAPPIAADLWNFVCERMARVMIGLPDAPAYIAVHGRHMAREIVDAVSDDDPPAIGVISTDIAVVQFAKGAVFPGLVVAVTPGEQPATAMVQAVDWFEARRL